MVAYTLQLLGACKLRHLCPVSGLLDDTTGAGWRHATFFFHCRGHRIRLVGGILSTRETPELLRGLENVTRAC